MAIRTADLCDANEDADVLLLRLESYGARADFAGPISTVKVHEDNVLVKAALAEPGRGRVLVVDGGGSMRCALVGDNLAAMARDNGWAGVVVYGCIRDAAQIAEMNVGVLALGTHPRKSVKHGRGDRDVEVSFGSVTFRPGAHLYADADGVIVSADPI